MKLGFSLSFIAALIFALSFTSCEDKEDITTGPDLGKEETAQKVAETIQDIQQRYATDPRLVQVDDFIEYDETVKIEVSTPRIITSTRLDIINREEDESSISITIKESITNIELDQTIIKEDVIQIPKASALFLTPSAHKDIQNNEFESLSLNTKETRQSFHNLRVTDIKVKAPKKWRNRTGCDDCEFEAVEIRYDVALWSDETTFEKIEVQEILLKESTPLAGTYLSCLSQLADFDGQRYFVKQCPTILRDFNK